MNRNNQIFQRLKSLNPNTPEDTLKRQAWVVGNNLMYESSAIPGQSPNQSSSSPQGGGRRITTTSTTTTLPTTTTSTTTLPATTTSTTTLAPTTTTTTTSTTTEIPYQEFTLLNTNPSVYANGASGSVDPISSRDGWYFKNTSPGLKINWYFFDGTTYSIPLSDMSAFAVIELDSTVSRPWLSILTKPTGTGDFFPGFFKSSRVYNWPSGSSQGVKYLIYFGQDPNIFPELPRVLLTQGTTQGAFLPTEEVFTVVLHSDSGATTGQVEFVAEKLGINTPNVKGVISLEIGP